MQWISSGLRKRVTRHGWSSSVSNKHDLIARPATTSSNEVVRIMGLALEFMPWQFKTFVLAFVNSAHSSTRPSFTSFQLSHFSSIPLRSRMSALPCHRSLIYDQLNSISTSLSTHSGRVALPLRLLPPQELLQNTQLLLQPGEPCIKLLVYSALIVSQFGIKVLSVGCRAHGS
jgi:hypothetical protein